ncbi:oxidoreductase [Noviherbaspirillum soli]|uniref:oxidoreductase n=1 Tax=Noviherbaspirillum soli TaxID=1064518 RepID=UPI00188B9D55|nr:oxidoreductase [Noviherbaspirillum soli]
MNDAAISGSSTAGGRTVLLVGATGLVGSACLRLLMADPTVSRVRTLTRRPLAQVPAAWNEQGKLAQQVVDFDGLEAHPAWLACSQVICALGTTMRQAGSGAAFRRVDHDYVLNVARLALTQGASHFLVVSSMGADAQSANFYYRVKGELEDGLKALGYPSLTIARPSLLLGERAEWRWGEELGKRLGVLLPPRWRPIDAEQVAAALVQASRLPDVGVRLLENAQLKKIALTP